MTKSLNDLNTELLTCRKCPRLVAWREEVAHTKRKAYKEHDYWGKPVPGFGDPQARVFVVGLAPGAHGSNRTGRQFTGDASGDFLYPALYRAGFASQPESRQRDDGLTLTDMYIAPVCRCAPPGNKPLPEEMTNCQPYLERELALIKPRVIVVLGRIAFERVLRIYSRPRTEDGRPSSSVLGLQSVVFSHGAVHPLNADPLNTTHWLVCSYHPSQQNTLTGKLTVEMFDSVWQKVKDLLTAL
jgi:uracil-DNA glycosylase family 4